MGKSAEPQGEAEDAIARVLRAEREAQDALARCTAQAAALVASARRGSEQIRARATRRIGALRARIAAAAERRIAGLADAAAGEAQDAAQEERLRRAAAALADELTGTAP